MSSERPPSDDGQRAKDLSADAQNTRDYLVDGTPDQRGTPAGVQVDSVEKPRGKGGANGAA